MNFSITRTSYALAARGYVEAAVLFERATTGVGFNPLSDILAGDPYPTYARLRERDPVHRSRVFNGWVLSRYAEVSSALKHPALTADRLRGKRRFFDFRRRPRRNSFYRTISKTMLYQDGEDHARLRAVIADRFSPRAAASLRGMVHEVVQEHLDALPADGQVELMQGFAEPVGETVIARILGMPVEERALVRPMAQAIQAALGPSVDATPLIRADRATGSLHYYFRRLIELRGPEPRNDVFSDLLAAAGTTISMDELYAMLTMLTLAGQEPLTSLLGNSVVALMRHPEARDQFLADPSLATSAVQELVRYDAPIQITSRVASEDCEVGGARVRAGQKLILLLASANRDPEQFESPDTLDLCRHPNQHLGFGRGEHYCLGAPLAAATVEIALPALFARYPRLSLAPEPPRYAASFQFRRPESLPVILR